MSILSLLLVATLAHDDYVGRELMIPMRDGVKLYTQIFRPREADEALPILLNRTPYELPSLRESAQQLGPGPAFAEAGYVFVRQDVRGQFRSEGEWEVLRPPRDPEAGEEATDETTDCHDTVAWLLENVEGHNGCVGMWGISYDAWQTVMAMAGAHPALRAVSPQASPADMFLGDDLHHHGAFRLSYTFAWQAFMAARRGDADPDLVGPALRADGYEFFQQAGTLPEITARYFSRVQSWNDIMQHGDYDEYWRRRNVLRLLDEVSPAVLNVAGWFDAEDFRGPIDIYHEVEEEDVEDRNFLVVGPWQHGGWNPRGGGEGRTLRDLDFGEATGEWYREEVELPFFEHHLREDADPLLPEVLAFETGANQWRELDAWPPLDVEERDLFLQESGGLGFEPGAEAAARFVSDPADPVPFTERGPVFPDGDYTLEDQRYLDGRDDVLSFLGEPLAEDLIVAGRPEVRLRFSTTGTDGDWIVKLIDVYPEDSEERSARTGESLAGAKILITSEIFRAKYRDDFSRPTPLEPGRPTELRFPLPDRLHRFRAGHRILVQLHSSWFPLYDRNPQTFTDIYHATVDEFQAATHTVHLGGEEGTRIVLPVRPR